MSSLQYLDYEFDSMLPMHEESDYDDLYDTIESFVDDQVHRLKASEDQAIEPAVNQHELTQLENEYNDLNLLYHQLNERIELVGEEMDVSYFYQGRKPLENRLKKLKKAIKASQRFVEVKDIIEKHRRHVVQLIQEALEADDFEEIADLEEGFDLMVDHCDTIADMLYQIENEKHDIQPLEAKFQSLTMMMERLQDVIDDAIYRISN